MAAEALPAPVCHVSVPVRRWARVSLVGWSDWGRARRCWASGLMVVGTGMMRVMWAVPSVSMWLELGMAVSGCCAVRASGKRRAASEMPGRMRTMVAEAGRRWCAGYEQEGAGLRRRVDRMNG